MSTQYLIIKNLQVVEANVHAGFYSAGLPSMTAFAGFLHALERGIAAAQPVTASDDIFGDEKVAPTPVAFKGFTPVFKVYDLSPGQARRVNAEDGLSGNKAASDAFDPLANLGLDLIIEVASGNATEAYKFLSTTQGRAVVQELRLSGGSLFWTGEATATETLSDALKTCSSQGFMLEDASELVLAEMQDSDKSMVSIFDSFIARPVPSENQDLPYQPRYVALGVGFRALEPQLHARECARHGRPHRFAEPVLGLARVRLVASVAKAQEGDSRAAVLWRQHPPTPSGYYLVRARTAA